MNQGEYFPTFSLVFILMNSFSLRTTPKHSFLSTVRVIRENYKHESHY